jgi:hypothetical protein
MTKLITPKTIKAGATCGFCRVGERHDLCPGGVLNGDQVTVITCGCEAHSILLRCLNCGERGEGVNGETWTCQDPESCESRLKARVDATVRDLYGDLSDPENTRTAPRALRVKERAPKAAKVGAECRCSCGGTTKGGKYLPGHDSRHLAAVQNLPATRDEKLAIFADSPALQAKLAKRLG